MSASDSKKKFGLILASARRAQEAHAGGVRRLNPLQDSDDELERDEEEESAMDWVQAALKKSGGGNSAQLAQQQRLMREALEQDSSVFQYDELYDDLQATRDTKRQEKEGQVKKPKYIHNILKFAERRKLEKERRTERKVQKEREAEKGLFKDKESFVTPAYLKKLEEMKKAEEQERIDAIIEEKNDVSKHKNMGIFFNHLFIQRMGEGEPSVKKEPGSPQAGSNSENSDAATAPTPADVNIRKRKGKSRGNQYRSQRAIDDSPTRPHEDQSKRRSSGRQDSSDSDAGSNTEGRRRRGNSKSLSASPRRESRSRSPLKNKSRRGRSRSQTPNKNKNKSKRKSDDVQVKIEHLSSDENEHKDKKIKSKKVGKRDNDKCEKKVESKESREERIIKLFAKRTVGDKFIEAQQRYFQRKAERLNNVAKGL